MLSLLKRKTEDVETEEVDEETTTAQEDVETEEDRGFYGRSEPLVGLDSLMSGHLSQTTLHPSPSTSTQMAGLALAETTPPTGNHGILLGIDVKTGSAVIHDPFVAYAEEEGFDSPNMTVFGDLGVGKSQMGKAWCCRNLMFGRRVIIVDKKLQRQNDGSVSEGEYSMMARRLGYEPITLRTGEGGRRINILDPRIAGDTTAGAAGQQMLLELVVRSAMGRALTEEERKALRVARHTAVARAQEAGRVAHVGDVVTSLLNPDPHIAEETAGVGSVGLLLEYGRACGFALERLVSEELAGLIDGPTDPRLDLDGQLICFDISSLPEDGPAVPIMMTVLNTWVRSLMARQEVTIPTVLLIDEAWHIVDGDFAAAARSNAKLARGLGMENLTLFQHPSDIPANSPAIAMIKECQTVFVFRQNKPEDAAGVCELLGWDVSLADQITRLEKGVAVIQIGTAAPVVCSMIMSDFELEIGDTNQAMVSTATVSAHTGREHDAEKADG